MTLPGLSLPAKLLIGLVGAILLFGAGVYVGDEWANGRHEKSDAKQFQASLELFKRARDRDASTNAAISGELAKTQAKAEEDRRDFDRRLRAAERAGVLAACPATEQPVADAADRPVGAGVAPGVRLTAVAVGLYHDALASGLPDAYGDWRADAKAGAPDSVEIGDLLRNVEDNGRLANQLRAQLLGWQRKACAEGWATPEQCEVKR